MVVTCIIEFDNNPYGTYFGGQVITGKVTLQSDKLKSVKAVLLKINGFAHTRWTESRSDSRKGSTERMSESFTGHEDYLASLTYLLGSDASSQFDIQPGIHTYTFACHLPITCPSSFEGLYGHVRYTVKVVLIRPWKFDQTFTKGFTVLKIMDLNYDSPLLRMPCHSEVQKTFCCGPCSSEPLQLCISLPQSGYVPGQIIPVSVLVTNDSRVPVEDIKVELVMLVTCYSDHPRSHTKMQRIVVTKLKGDSVPRHCKKLFNYDLRVPATPPTCFNLCRILQITYQVEVEAKIKGFHANQVLCVPVTIGNVPLMIDTVVQQQPTTSNGSILISPRIEQLNLNGNSDKTDYGNDIINAQTKSTIPWAAKETNIPPPSYEEAVHMQHGKICDDEPHDYGENSFAPRYPVFNVSSPSAPSATEVDGGGTWL